MNKNVNRRNFIKTTASVATGIAGLSILPNVGLSKNSTLTDGIHIIGPKEGFSPQVGTLLSMMTWMRNVVVLGVENMKKEELDYLHDPNANTIGAMLLHLAATERQYQIKTFEWNIDFKGDGKINWDAAMRLGDKGRKSIKGNSLDYYLDILNETRLTTISEFKKRDDNWLSKVDPAGFQSMPTNNYCKWFHVCEHESNHNGQIKWIKSRLPGAKPGND
jgi:Protein of unknown function (DUF664)